MILASILIADEGARDQLLSPKVEENIASFKQHHPGLEHHLFRGPELRAFIAAEYDGEVLAAYDALKPYAYKSDLARLCLLLKHGGVYADLSVFFLAPWFLASWNEAPNRVGVFRDFLNSAPWQAVNTVIFAPPGHKAIARAIESICDNVKRRYYGTSSLCPTGPVAFGKAIAESCLAEDLFVGDSVRCNQVNGHPGLITPGTHGLVFQDRLVAVKRKRGGGPVDEIGVTGGNLYYEMWEARDIYNPPAP